jgi:hypothetical protein
MHYSRKRFQANIPTWLGSETKDEEKYNIFKERDLNRRAYFLR